MVCIQAHKCSFLVCVLTLVFFVASVEAVDIAAPASLYRTFGVDTQFDKEGFYDRKIVGFSFVKGTWNDLAFDHSTLAFKPITDVLRIRTNVPNAEIDSASYQLSMIKNWSQCISRDGEMGSRDIVTVSVVIDGVPVEVTEMGTPIGDDAEGKLSFEQNDRGGLSADHEVVLTFSPIDYLFSDRYCRGVVTMSVALGL
ncbi:hypothetical protein BS049_RS23285 [Vibrio parahaemolyticus]|nr:hypothetical protein [Vibrio parahaemolyticus]